MDHSHRRVYFIFFVCLFIFKGTAFKKEETREGELACSELREPVDRNLLGENEAGLQS